jgi:hypothetical protein
MTVRELIERLQEIELPDALVVRRRIGGERAAYDETGSHFDILSIRRSRNGDRFATWVDDHGLVPNDAEYEQTWAVVL